MQLFFFLFFILFVKICIIYFSFFSNRKKNIKKPVVYVQSFKPNKLSSKLMNWPAVTQNKSNQDLHTFAPKDKMIAQDPI